MTATDMTPEAFEQARNLKLQKSAESLIAELRKGDRLLSPERDRAQPTHMRPGIKKGKTVRRDASFNLADDLMDLETALRNANFDDARVLYYRIRKTIGR